jgi:hypothetical protein
MSDPLCSLREHLLSCLWLIFDSRVCKLFAQVVN